MGDWSAADIADMLDCIPADGQRAGWVRTGMALKSYLPGPDGFALFEAWSKSAPDKFDPKDCRATWDGFRQGGSVGFGTLVHVAHHHGYRRNQDRKPLSSEERARLERQRADAARQATEAQKRDAARRTQAIHLAAHNWDAACPANDNQPYLKAKGVRAHGLRLGVLPMVRDDGSAYGIPNALLVPLRDGPSGEVVSLQGIFPGKGGEMVKRFPKGGRKRGCYHLIGTRPDFDSGQPLAFAEGYATGATVHELTGWPVVICFDSGGMVSVSMAFREKYANAQFLFCADNDQWTEGNPGMTEAAKAAGATRGHVIAPEFQDTAGRPTDWNDKALLDGGDATRKQLLAHLNEINTMAGDLAQPVNDNSLARDEERRARQKDENRRIQDDDQPPSGLPEFMTVEDMVADCVWIADGSLVGRISSPRQVLCYKDFCNLTASSATMIIKEGSNRSKRTLHADGWKLDVNRKTVATRTFHAGAGVICHDPDGQTALNTWRPIARRPSNRDVGPFLDHVAYLFADATERETFLDWLAHIEQRPGVLPHYGWLHIAANTGTGRNWLASVLARVWRGSVAPNVDLPALLESPYNGDLGGRTLAIVDEVQEGGGENPYRLVNKLKSMVNMEIRTVNPKFGRQYREHNACRWLVFSNHENALPLNDTDRRWRVVKHDAAPRAPAEYAQLYALLGDAAFSNAMGVFLRNRDISGFNPGERPPMNDAKRAAVEASKSLVQQDADGLVAGWPADVITNGDAASVLSEGNKNQISPAMRRALVEAGAAPYQGANGRVRPIKVYGAVVKCWILRNVTRWAGGEPAALATEARRARGSDSTLSAMDVLVRLIRETTPDDPPF